MKPLFLLTFLALASCQPGPVEKAIAEYEQATKDGSIELNVDVIEYHPIDTVTAADSAAMIRELLTTKEENIFLSDRFSFDNQFAGTALAPYYSKMVDYEARPGDMLLEIVQARIEKDNPLLGARQEINRSYAVQYSEYGAKVVFIVK